VERRIQKCCCDGRTTAKDRCKYAPGATKCAFHDYRGRTEAACIDIWLMGRVRREKFAWKEESMVCVGKLLLLREVAGARCSKCEQALDNCSRTACATFWKRRKNGQRMECTDLPVSMYRVEEYDKIVGRRRHRLRFFQMVSFWLLHLALQT
jgi:hypothetical protein